VEHATQTVFGAGPSAPRIMLIGEQPGDAEDRAGEPFVGPAGRILDEALDEAGLDRESIFVTNVVKHFKWRPSPASKRRLHERPNRARWSRAGRGSTRGPGDRPVRIGLLGATAAQACSGVVQRDPEHGRVEATELAPVVVATIHPSAVLRSAAPSRKEKLAGMVADLRLLASTAGGRAPVGGRSFGRSSQHGPTGGARPKDGPGSGRRPSRKVSYGRRRAHGRRGPCWMSAAAPRVAAHANGVHRRSQPPAPARDASSDTANATIAPTTSQKLFTFSKNGSWKFMPMIPARTTAGSRTAEEEREQLHRVVRGLGRPAHVDVERPEQAGRAGSRQPRSRAPAARSGPARVGPAHRGAPCRVERVPRRRLGAARASADEADPAADAHDPVEHVGVGRPAQGALIEAVDLALDRFDELEVVIVDLGR
jgi:DNA polymerase